MSSIMQSVEEMIGKTPDRDNQASFSALWGIMSALKERIAQRFSLSLDPSVADLANYGSADESTIGSLAAYSGDAIDWMIHSFMGTPSRSFCNMHLTVWLGPEIDVPHFGMALGTIPDIFCYLDFVPRVDLMADLDYLDRYYGERNQACLELEANPEFSPFVSRTLYMRQAQSRASFCHVAKAKPENLATIEKAAHLALDQWLALVDAARPVPAAAQPALAARDLLVRRAISERDPANIMGEKIFGKDMTERLVGTLWGKGRHSARPGNWPQ